MSASEQIARQFANAAVNKRNWGPIGYNVLDFGLAGDGVTDDTAALQALINTAIVDGRKNIIFPHTSTGGEYYVTALTNSDQVDFIGDNCSFVGGYTGTIANLGGLADVQTDLTQRAINVKSAPFNAVGDGVTDDTDAIQAAIDACGGTHDLSTAYVYQPAYVLYLPPGVYLISDRLLITNNNIRIIGAGMFNTTIKATGSANIREMIRFRGAYACELNNLSLDGGLPFTPTGSETYGADIGLVLDQCAHFKSISLNICNTRYEGKRCIHLWESYFEELRIFNTGFFGTGGLDNRSAGIRFTALGKEDETFPGGESNNITYNKVAFSTVGSYVSVNEVPTYNIYFHDVIAEGRTWSVNYPSLGESKWRLGATTRNLTIDNGYTYAHEQPFDVNVTLFDINNIGTGCKILNYSVYQENTLSGHSNEISYIMNVAMVPDLEVNISVDDIGGLNGYLSYAINSNADAIVTGKLLYKTDAASRTVDSLFNGTSRGRFSGEVIIIDDTGTNRYDNLIKGSSSSVIGSGTTQYEEFKCRAWVSFNGVTGTILASGNVASVTRNSVGNYTVTFTNAMPDANYAAIVSANRASSPTESPEIGGQVAGSINIANRAGTTYYDPTIVNVAVYR